MNLPNLNWKKRIVVSSWLAWEKLFNTVFSMQSIEEENELLHYRIRKYHGRKIILNDGKVIRKGDLIAELHFNNGLFFQAIADSNSSIHLAVRLLRETDSWLPKLADLLNREPDGKHVKAVYGISMIYRGTEQFGFTTQDLPESYFSFFTRFYLKLLLVVLHPQGKKRLKSHPELWKPKIIAMSADELFKRYDSKHREA